jgi:hypothetical protein
MEQRRIVTVIRLMLILPSRQGRSGSSTVPALGALRQIGTACPGRHRRIRAGIYAKVTVEAPADVIGRSCRWAT